jgi:hypothetical protein
MEGFTLNALRQAHASKNRVLKWTSTQAKRAAGVVFVLVVVAATACGSPSAVPSEGSRDTSSTLDSPASTSPELPLVMVPEIIGMGLKDARGNLTRAGLTVGEITKKYSHWDAGTVLRVSSGADGNVPEGTAIALVIAQAYPKVPNVVGLSAAKATSQLKSAGYKVSITKMTSSHPAGTVISMSPAAGSELLPGKTIEIVVAKAAAPVSNCNPNYSGACIPNVSYDLDCGDVSATNFHVVGYDQYGFDGDGDGIACEG